MASQRQAVERFCRSGFTFPVRDVGPADRPAVVALHGFPGGADTWNRVVPRLVEAGYRVLVPEQRGYAAEARPRTRAAYQLGELVGDVIALADAAGLERFHVAGHDWGGVVGWALAAARPERLHTLTVLSAPHPAAMMRSLVSSLQLARSSYIGLFSVPVVPERLLLAGNGALLRAMLLRSGLDSASVDGYVRRMSEPHALSGALAWYRALRPGWAGGVGRVAVPTSYVWGRNDAAIGERAAALTEAYAEGPYRFEAVDSHHWLPECEPDLVASAIVIRAETG